MEIIELAGQEKELWIDKVEPIQREYVKKMNERGLNGQGILDTVKQLAEKYNDEMMNGER